jgi:hypothetical protein
VNLSATLLAGIERRRALRAAGDGILLQPGQFIMIASGPDQGLWQVVDHTKMRRVRRRRAK